VISPDVEINKAKKNHVLWMAQNASQVRFDFFTGRVNR
jgi:hypothetical protein